MDKGTVFPVIESAGRPLGRVRMNVVRVGFLRSSDGSTSCAVAANICGESADLQALFTGAVSFALLRTSVAVTERPACISKSQEKGAPAVCSVARCAHVSHQPKHVVNNKLAIGTAWSLTVIQIAVRIYAGAVCALVHGRLRWRDLQMSHNLHLSKDAVTCGAVMKNPHLTKCLSFAAIHMCFSLLVNLPTLCSK